MLRIRANSNALVEKLGHLVTEVNAPLVRLKIQVNTSIHLEKTASGTYSATFAVVIPHMVAKQQK